MNDISLLTLYALVIANLTFTVYIYLGKVKGSKSEMVATPKEFSDILLARLKDQDLKIAELDAQIEILGLKSRQQRDITDVTKVDKSDEQVYAPITSESRETGLHKTDVVLRVLGLLMKGERTAKDVMVELNCTREHAARLMKMLYEKRYVERDERGKPFVYRITDLGRKYVEGG
ncbi:MAG: hypothetical protein QXG05_05200 [Nitrososphaerota archaeon]